MTTVQGGQVYRNQPMPGSVVKPIQTEVTIRSEVKRVASIDVYRGFVMLLMLLEMVHIDNIARRFMNETTVSETARSLWSHIHFNTTHVAWMGGSLHDLIQPSFSFLVGCALALSVRKRMSLGQSFARRTWHALFRSCLLVALGVLLRSLSTDHIDFRFDDTLCQIGLGYFFLYLISYFSPLAQWASFFVILGGYWIAFVAYPVSPADFDYVSQGVPVSWDSNYASGYAAHFNKNSNLAWAFDRWWMNLFPRSSPFMFSDGGYSTLSAIPTLATMILGLIVGRWMIQVPTFSSRALLLLLTAAIFGGAAWALQVYELSPIVKRIWTPSWVLWSGAWCCGILCFFHLICDQFGLRSWAYSLTVIGSNSILAYVMSYTTAPFLEDRFTAWLSPLWPSLEQYQSGLVPVVVGVMTFIAIWLILYWLNLKKLFVRI